MIVLIKSASGYEYQIPFKPKNSGRNNINGRKQIICLKSESIKASFVFPIA